MPELPEVETIAADVRPHLTGARIVGARVHRPDVLRRVSGPRFERELTGRRIRKVGRRAKHLVLELDDARRLVIQPRMTGSLLVVPAKSRRDPYEVFGLVLDTGRRALYRDVRRLGAVYLLDEPAWKRYDEAIGPEPLERSFTARRLAAILSASRAPIKKLLMDQRRLAGVGNIYANEALWMSGIDPSRESAGLLAAEVKQLHSAVVRVLRRSIAGRGTTLRDYRTGTGEPGTFQGRLAVYGRAGAPCLRCRRRIVLTHVLDGRATYFCPGCQR